MDRSDPRRVAIDTGERLRSKMEVLAFDLVIVLGVAMLSGTIYQISAYGPIGGMTTISTTWRTGR